MKLTSTLPPHTAMEWVFKLFGDVLKMELKRMGNSNPADEDLRALFNSLLPTLSARVLVQEPVPNSVRFKWLAFYYIDELGPLIDSPTEFLAENFGGGKFKINFYQGMHFLATVNFIAEGPERWRDLPEVVESET